jgi:hypothetical protein
LENGIDPRHAARPGIQRPPVVGDLRTASLMAHAGNSNDSANTVNANRDSEDALVIPKPPDDDRQSVHFLAYEFVEFYVKPNRDVPQEVIRILKKMFCPIL